jgi:hypothetical protein
MALVSEGPSDDAFLSAVLARSAEGICPAGTQVDDGLVVRAAAGPASQADTLRVLESYEGAFGVVVVHHDGDSDPEGSRQRWVTSLDARWRAAGHLEPVVGVVPIRETETWALADSEALWRMVGRPRGDRTLGLPSRRADLEKMPDPKRTLRTLFERCGRWDPAYLERLGRLVSLERLRELPAFQRWENDLAEALQTLPGSYRSRKAP